MVVRHALHALVLSVMFYHVCYRYLNQDVGGIYCLLNSFTSWCSAPQKVVIKLVVWGEKSPSTGMGLGQSSVEWPSVWCYRDPGEAGPPPRGKCCQSYLSKIKTLVSTFVNNQGLVAARPQPHQSIKQVSVNSTYTSLFMFHVM